jgi:hypothetical protein
MFTAHAWTMVLVIWAAGWLICSTFTAISKPMRPRDFIIALLGSLALNLFLWPGSLYEDLRDAWPKIAVKAGIRPKWTLPQPDDVYQKTWRLKAGGDFSATAFGMPGSARVVAELDKGTVSYRVRMLKPEERPPTKWRRMQRLSDRELVEATEDAASPKEMPPLQSDFRIERGRYGLEFKVETSGEPEEFSGIVLAVS